jgi:CHAT domain-containing protein/tetratricopeptide (TPR) repeat protein
MFKAMRNQLGSVVIALVLGCLPVQMIFCEVGWAQTESDHKAEADQLLNKGNQLDDAGQYREALQTYEQALQIYREIKDRKGEGSLLNNLGTTYSSLGQYQKAIDYYQQSLTITKQLANQLVEAVSLNNLGNAYRSLGQYQEAINYYQLSLVIFRQIGNHKGELSSLNNLSKIYNSLGQNQKAIESHLQSLDINKKIGDLNGEASALNSLGIAYSSLGQYQKAIDYYQQSLAIAKKIGSLKIEMFPMIGLGNVYNFLSQYQKAIDYYQKSLAIAKKIGDLSSEGILLNNLGDISNSLGQPRKAIEFHQQSLAIAKKIGDLSGEGVSLNGLGNVYSSLKQYQKAINYYQKSLLTRKKNGDLHGEGITLISLGNAYNSIGQHQEAIEFHQQSLAITKRIGDRSSEGYSLISLGDTYNFLEQYQKAIEYYQQSLAIAREISDRKVEGSSLNNIGYLFLKQKQPELAIVFYKQSVNVRESIRKSIQGLSKEEKESYLSTIAQTYRDLADLLLKQGRILEAQQVLELLKVEEIRAYTRNTRAVDDTNGIATNKTETKTIDKHSSLIALGLRVDQCEQQKCPELRQLIKERQDVANEYDKTVETLVKEIRDRTTNDKAFFDPTLVGKMEDIVSAQPKTILIYHLILKDKIWVLWASKGGITKSIEVPNVGLEKVSSNVLQLRNLLKSPENLEELQKTSQQLREWLIPPQLQAELSANDIKHLVFAPDSVTRYIPMGVLYDGKKYLVENYTIATIISAGLTDTTSRLPNPAKNTSVLAAGLSQPVSGYSPLPNVLTEINAIVRTADNPNNGIYDGIKLLDSTFTKDSLLDNLGSHAIAHIATHGKFVSGDPDKSFLVLGNGKTLPIPEIKKLRGLSKLHLVVLSACQTALGGTNGDGTEISGISYFFLGIGAKSVIASLWEVSDDSTSLLMQQFYNNLSKSSDSTPVTKSEAMQQAQLSLLRKQITAKDNIQRGNIAVVYRGGSKPTDNYSHPYYWSPFILIGNGL